MALDSDPQRRDARLLGGDNGSPTDKTESRPGVLGRRRLIRGLNRLPFAPHLEYATLPNAERIVAAVRALE